MSSSQRQGKHGGDKAVSSVGAGDKDRKKGAWKFDNQVMQFADIV